MVARGHLQAEWAWSCLAVRLLYLEPTALMRQQVVLPPHLAPGCITPTTPHRAPSSATMVVAMRASDASTKVSVNHKDQGATATRRRIPTHSRPPVSRLSPHGPKKSRMTSCFSPRSVQKG